MTTTSEAQAVFWNISALKKLYFNNIPKNLTIKQVRQKMNKNKQKGD